MSKFIAFASDGSFFSGRDHIDRERCAECGEYNVHCVCGEPENEPEKLDGVYDPGVPFTTCDVCWCAPGTGPAHPNCPMHGEMPCISIYTRAQAIDDGVLVDCGCFMWRGNRIVDLIGFVYPVAMTAGAYNSITEGCKVGTEENKVALAGCLSSLWLAIKRSTEVSDVLHFTCQPIYNPGAKVPLWSKCGPGDTAAPVLTIMLEGED